MKWHDDKVGYDPGQSQTVTINFVARIIGSVLVSYKFSAKSLGQDDYTSNQRYNKVTISINGFSDSFTYQLHGAAGTSTSHEGSFWVYNVANGVTSLKVKYNNQRLGVDNPQYGNGKKTTGNTFGAKKIGSVSIPDNTKHNAYFYSGYSGNVTGMPSNIYGVYLGDPYYIPINILTDQADHYVFNNGYNTAQTGGGVNLYGPSVSRGQLVTMNGDIAWIGCWTPQVYTYRFFQDNSFTSDSEFKPDLSRKYTYTYSPTAMPDLNKLSEKDGLEANNPKSTYYKKGYEFVEWNYYYRNNNKTNGVLKTAKDSCNTDFNAFFFPTWEGIESEIHFHYGFDDVVRNFKYKYGEPFDLLRASLDKDDNKKDPALIRPGYRLVGWSYNDPGDIIYNPFATRKGKHYSYGAKESTAIDYKDDSFSNYEFKHYGIDLYAVWEYYTSVYVYNDKQWKLAMPLVYDKDGQWKMCLAYTNVSKTPSWKL